MLTNVSSYVLELGPVGDEFLLGWYVNAHVTRKPDGRRSNPDVHLLKEKSLITELTLNLFTTISNIHILEKNP